METTTTTHLAPNGPTPPKQLWRNGYGLIVSGTDYFFADNGFIDWRKMVKNKYLVPNKAKTEEKDITKLDDSKLLITLAGIRDLARVRGYTSVQYRVQSMDESFVSVICKINWMGNFETHMTAVEYESLADASKESTTGFAMNYLSAIAENRAFVRNVRGFLNIGVVGEEEVGATESSDTPLNANTPPSAHAILTALMVKKKISFEHIKAKLVEEKFQGVDKIDKLEQIPLMKVLELIDRLKKAKKA